MDKDKRTAEIWYELFYPALIVYNFHGFGASYNKGVDQSFYDEPITLEEFEQKLLSCSIMQCPVNLRATKEKLEREVVSRNKKEIMNNPIIIRQLYARLENGLFRVSNGNYPWSGKRFRVTVLTMDEQKDLLLSAYTAGFNYGKYEGDHNSQDFDEWYGNLVFKPPTSRE